MMTTAEAQVETTTEDEHASTIVVDVLFTSANDLFERLKDVCRSDTDSLVVSQLSAETYRMLKDERDRCGSHYRFLCVVGAPLVLRFEDFMDRPPVPAAGEHDILLSEADLQLVAKCVW